MTAAVLVLVGDLREGGGPLPRGSEALVRAALHLAGELDRDGRSAALWARFLEVERELRRLAVGEPGDGIDKLIAELRALPGDDSG